MQTRKRARLVSIAAGSLALAAFAVAAGAQDEPQAPQPQPQQQEQGPQRLTIRGTSVTLTAPPGFTASRTERGIENAATGTKITISEAAAEAYPGLADRFKSAKSLTDGYADQNVTIRSVRTVDGKIPFAIGRQTKDGKDLTRYLALLKGDKTVLVSFTVPDRTFTEADAEALLRSIELTPEPTLEERLAQLPFVLTAAPPYTVRDVINRQAVNLEVKGDRAQPAITIGYGRSQALMGEEARVAVELIKSTGGYREAQITSQEPVTFAGGKGYRVTAVIEDRTAVQYLRIVSGGGYIRLFARGTTSAMQNAEQVIAEIAGSVEPR
ncbi:MAG TPA: hypothetical protein VFL84_07995 [Gammaproteobacteria bacterium]|nr:hypothetical protein [Gammaproteobacteria bacterium]